MNQPCIAWVFFQPPSGEGGLDFPAETTDPATQTRKRKLNGDP